MAKTTAPTTANDDAVNDGFGVGGGVCSASSQVRYVCALLAAAARHRLAVGHHLGLAAVDR